MQSFDEMDADIRGRLQSADYFNYMAEDSREQSMNKYFNPHATAREIFQHYTNLVADIEISLIRKPIDHQKKHSIIRHIPFNILTN